MSDSNLPNPKPLVHLTETVEGFVVLPFGQEEFRDFIQSLLGTKQSTTRHISGSFTLKRDDLLGIHYVLMQRVEQQNQSSLIQFRSKLIFDDKSTITLNSYAELQTYNEVRPLVVKAIYMTWDLLVKFQDKDKMER